MEQLFKKPFLAVEAVLYLACKGGPDPVRSGEMAEYIGVPVRYLEKLMQKLVHAGILRSVRGPKGGYLLAKERRNISLKDIFTAINSDNDSIKDEYTSPLRKNIIMAITNGLLEDIHEVLDQISVQSICDVTKPQHKIAIKKQKPDFII